MSLAAWSSFVTLIAIGLTSVIVVYAWGRYRPLAVVVPVWFLAAWGMSQRGFFQSATGWSDGDLINFTLFGTLMSVPLVLFFVGWQRLPAFRAFADGIPLTGLLGIQIYRLAGAIFLWMYAVQLMPPELGILTGIADVTVGLSALPLAWAIQRQMRGIVPIAIGWNLFGITDFVLAVSMVSLSIFGLAVLQPAPVRIGLHPLALIALFQLPISISLHWLALRRLIGVRKALTASPNSIGTSSWA